MNGVEETYAASRKVLRMVQELHVLGYQKLRVAPGMSPSGMSWRCSITPRSNTLRSNGALMNDWDRCVHYSSGQGREYFGWTDLAYAHPMELAQRFVKRYDEIAREGKGEDWPYAGWYVWMMHLCWPDTFPIAYADGLSDRGVISTIGFLSISVPLPPPGDAEDSEFVGGQE